MCIRDRSYKAAMAATSARPGELRAARLAETRRALDALELATPLPVAFRGGALRALVACEVDDAPGERFTMKAHDARHYSELRDVLAAAIARAFPDDTRAIAFRRTPAQGPHARARPGAFEVWARVILAPPSDGGGDGRGGGVGARRDGEPPLLDGEADGAAEPCEFRDVLLHSKLETGRFPSARGVLHCLHWALSTERMRPRPPPAPLSLIHI